MVSRFSLVFITFLMNISLFLGAMEHPKEKLCFSYGQAITQGKRPTMEDVAFVEPSSIDDESAWLSIYDGHGGEAWVANLACARILNNFKEKINQKKCINKAISDQDIKTFLHESCMEVDSFLKSKSIYNKYGTTALISLIHNKKIFLSWIGDSKGIVIRAKDVILKTKDHKGHRFCEYNRVSKAGGKFSRYVCHINEQGKREYPLQAFDTIDQALEIPDTLFNNPLRIGGIAMTRSLGDWDVKQLGHAGFDCFIGIIPNPEIKSIPTENGDIIVLASDGLWDVISPSHVAFLVTHYFSYAYKKIAFLQKRYESPEHVVCDQEGNNIVAQFIAQKLRDIALARAKENADNISVIVAKVEYTNDELTTNRET